MAQALGVRQDIVLQLERRSDLLLTTMRRYVEAIGGQVEIVGIFPNRPSAKPAHVADISGKKRGVYLFRALKTLHFSPSIRLPYQSM